MINAAAIDINNFDLSNAFNIDYIIVLDYFMWQIFLNIDSL
jgi:hypothetical protein